MSKVIAGLSEEDSISFTSRKSKITVHFNGRIEYKEIIKTDKESKLEFPLSPVFILIFILEFLLSLLFRWRGVSGDAVRIGTIFSCVYFVYVINSFSSRKSTKRNHAAEHMVYNANRKGVDLTLENVRKSKIFCEYCGSCYIGNVIFISLINIPLVIYTGFWIPYTFIFWLCRNLPKGIPLNPFTHLMQVGVTAEPSDFNLFISLLAMNMVKQIDEYKEINEEIGPQAVVGLLDLEVGKLVRDNDFDFDTSNLKTIFNEKNGGLWPPFFSLLKSRNQKNIWYNFCNTKKRGTYMDVRTQKCPGCGATLKWNPTTESFICEYCGLETTMADIQKQQDFEKTSNVGNATSYGTVKTNDGEKEKVIYSCPNCGAELMTDELTTATKCVYCKSTTVIKDKMQGEFLPDEVIPFSKTKQDAINGFKSCLKGKWFAPRAFTNPKNINEITGVYVPFWLYDCDVTADVAFDGKKITTWTSGEYQYTKTDTYDVKRSGTMKYEKVPVDGSEKAEDALMDSIEPFDYNKMQKYNDAYLSGFLAEKYDVDKEKAAERMSYRVENTAIDVLKGTASYDTMTVKNKNIDIDQKQVKYVMLPVWMLNIKYKNKMYKFAMNGETGKMIGQIPKSAGKVIGLTLLTWLIISLIAFVVCLITNLQGGM